MRGDFFSTIVEIIKYGGSTFAALIAMSIYTTTDGFFIGNWVGNDGLEALALIYPIFMVFIALGTLFETGGSAVVAKEIGEGKIKLAEVIMRSSYLVAFIIGIIFVIVGNISIEPLLNILANQSDEQHIVNLATSFLHIYFFGLPFLIVIYLSSAFMRCIEKPMHVLYLIGATSLANIILDALFIIMFGWGMNGAASATLISQIIGAIISLYYFKYSRQKFKTPFRLGSFSYVFQEIKIGAGFAVTIFMMCFIEYFLNAVLLYHDASNLLVAAAIANIILGFIYLPLDGLDTGIQPLISRLFAAKKEQDCIKVMRYGFYLTMILTFTIYFVIIVFTREISNLFSNEPLTDDMIIFLRALFIVQPFVGIYTWLGGILVALEDEWRNLVISILPLFVQVPLIWLLPKFLPIKFISLNYSALDFAEAAVAFILIRPFLKEKGLSLKKIFDIR